MGFAFPGVGSFWVVGVVNLTPDSFYAPSRCPGIESAMKRAEQMLCEGAHMLDLGAESTRPGAQPVAEDMERKRLLPVLRELRRSFPSVPLSVDTSKSEVARAALDAGADCINDVTGLQGDKGLAGVVAGHHAGVIAMHMRGTPRTMQENPRYDDPVAEITLFLRRSMEIAEISGIAPERVALDPGIGFGKTLAHNLAILKNIGRFCELGRAVMLGASRKSFISQLLGVPEEARLEGSLAAAVLALQQGARLFRVHDVRATLQALRTAQAVIASSGGEKIR